MTAIIWGANGQDGFYLDALLQQQGYKVIGISRSGNFTRANLCNFDEVCTKINSLKPAFFFHLVANSTTSHNAWKENHDTINPGTLHILEAVKQFAPACKVFLSGSGLQFVNNGSPIKESDAFAASSIYSVARIHTVYAARYYRSLGLQVYVGYLFHHDSPQRSDRHINKKIILTAQQIAGGAKQKLALGDVSVQKEFGFAGDLVKGMWTLVNQQQIYEAVIGTGIANSIDKWIDICFGLYGLSWQDHFEKREGFVPEFKVLVSHPETMHRLGWQHQTSINELAKMMMP